MVTMMPGQDKKPEDLAVIVGTDFPRLPVRLLSLEGMQSIVKSSASGR